MANYLIDRETLGEFVDELIKKKPLPVNTVEELEKLRESAIESLDEKIGLAIFSQFTESSNVEFNHLIDVDADELAFENFFHQTGIDVEKTMTETMKQFANEFLEGDQNA